MAAATQKQFSSSVPNLALWAKTLAKQTKVSAPGAKGVVAVLSALDDGRKPNEVDSRNACDVCEQIYTYADHYGFKIANEACKLLERLADKLEE